MRTIAILSLALASNVGFAAAETIDRHALVTRHNIEWNDLHGQIPLGNGEFCFNADATGLQTFGGSTMSHWGWHSAALPPGCTPADLPPTGTVEKGRITGPMRKAAERGELDSWMFRNPHPMNLGRLRLVRPGGAALETRDIGNVTRKYDLWTGLHTSRFEVDGQTVTVETCVHPTLDLIAVRAESPLLRDGKLVVALDFPYPSANGGPQWAGDWNRPGAHTSELALREGENHAGILRTADASAYHAAVAWSRGRVFRKWPEAAGKNKKMVIVKARFGGEDRWVDVTDKVAAAVQDNCLALTPSFDQLGDPLPGRTKKLQVSYTLDGDPKQAEVQEGVPLLIQAAVWKHIFMLSGAKDGRMEFACGFSGKTLDALPTVAQTQQAVAGHWKSFWNTGGAIDLSESKDPRWMELERRIVLSQYQMAAQSAGSWPSAENGLTGVDFWSSQFHMEMVWWHLAHYGLWDRWPMADRALDCYQKFLPVARQLARQFDYKGAKWGKQVGPEGRTAPWDGSFVLHWQQPHPIFFAELEYRLRPTRTTLEKWKDVVFATAEYMADFPTPDGEGIYHLKPVMPACEEPTTYDTVFELAYWRFGLDTAQQWRERLGLSREPRWDEVRARLAPLPVNNGVFILSPDRLDRQGGSHPDAIGVYGMLPSLSGVDQGIAKATMKYMTKDSKEWKCMGWGWDFPWMAMAAARNGEPNLAIEALLHPSSQNNYDQRGVCTGGPCPYFPGNGGLLYAVAMMAAGWDGAPQTHAPGFPTDGSWVVKWEGLKRAP